jgi:hypothetical protein
MKEVTFLQQNASRWRHYEGILNNVEFLTAPRLAELFSELSEDLSFSRSFYPDSNTTAYLNYLTYRVMRELGRPRRTTGSNCGHFGGENYLSYTGKPAMRCFSHLLSSLPVPPWAGYRPAMTTALSALFSVTAMSI